MRYLFARWSKIEPELKENRLLLFLDFDGTLANITGRPQDARLDRRIGAALKSLSRLAECQLAIISGRNLKDLRRRVGIGGIIYSGNHGLETEGPKINFCVTLLPNYRVLLGKLKEALRRKISAISGVIIEDKGLTLSVHYRLAQKRDLTDIKTIFHETVIMPLVKNKIRIRLGKKVLEIRPAVKWDKGKAVLWLLARQKFAAQGKRVLPIFIGDDITDEDAFRVLKNRGMTIFVGRPRRRLTAQYFLRNTAQVRDFLSRLVKLKS